MCLVTRSCLTLCDPMYCSLPGSSVHGDSPCNNIGMGCHALLQGIFPTQGSNPGLLHCRWFSWILYQLSHQESPTEVAQSCPTLCSPMGYTVHGILQARILEGRAFLFSRGSSQPRDWTQVSHIAFEFFTTSTNWEAQETNISALLLTRLQTVPLPPRFH